MSHDWHLSIEAPYLLPIAAHGTEHSPVKKPECSRECLADMSETQPEERDAADAVDAQRQKNLIEIQNELSMHNYLNLHGKSTEE